MGWSFTPDPDPSETLSTLREIEAREKSSRIVGNYDILVAPRDALVKRRRYIEALLVAIQAAIDEGKTPNELYK